MSRGFTLVLILILTVSSLIIVKPEHALAQTTTPTSPPQVTASSNPTSNPTSTPPITTPIPSPTPVYPKLLVPEFTVNFVVSSPELIVLTIKNQPFNNNNIYHYSFFYNVRTKINDGNWSNIYTPEDGYPTQSNSDYTVLSFSSTSNGYFIDSSSHYNGIYAPSNAKLDFQVEAMVGYRERGIYSGGVMPYVFKGETSEWSNTLTLTIPASVSPFPTSPNQGNSQSTIFLSTPEFPIVTALVVLVVVCAIVGIVLRRRRR